MTPICFLPQVNPDEIERELAALGEPWLVCYWSTPDEIPHNGLSREHAHIMRQTLLRLDVEVCIRKGEIHTIKRLPLGARIKKVGAKADTLGRGFAPL